MMKLIKVDSSLVRRPENILCVPTQKLANSLIAEFKLSGNIGERHVSVVGNNGSFVAVDNIEILDAAIAAKIKKINLLHLGNADPEIKQIEIASSKTMVNPARIVLAVNDILKNSDGMKFESINTNSYLANISYHKFNDKVLKLIADLTDHIFSLGIEVSPPITFFNSLYDLKNEEEQKTVIEMTQLHGKELNIRFFHWPNTITMNHMLDTKKTNAHTKTKESTSKNMPIFDCVDCGHQYTVLNDDVCSLKLEKGCLVVQDRVGTVIHTLPENVVKFLGLDESTTPPRFAKYNSIEEIKKLDIKGPLIIGFPKNK